MSVAGVATVRRAPLGAIAATAVETGLAVTVAIATAAAAVAGGWVDGAGGVVLVAAVGATEAAILARSPLSRAVSLMLVVPLAASAIVPLTVSATARRYTVTGRSVV